MKRLIAAILLLCGATLFSEAQEKPEYDVAHIPDSLKANAHTIVRKRTQDMRVSRPGKATIEVLNVVTALDVAGIDDLLFFDYEDDFRKLSTAEVRIYDAKGNLLKKYKKKEMEKQRGNDGFSLIVDDKVFSLEIPPYTLPFTVESYTEVQLSGFIDFEDFITATYDEAIQYSAYTITTTPDNPVRYKNFRCNLQPVVADVREGKSWRWEVNNVRALQSEEGMPRRTLPRVMITPAVFEMDGYTGQFTSWQQFGKWYFDLNTGSTQLAADKFQYFRNLVNDIPDTLEKIRKLYSYVQQNCRYVSVQLGIGGFKSFNAEYVDRNKYGDCKALSNFMQTLLGVAGIKSYPALINAGYTENPIDAQFANNSFNHVILCVPRLRDSVWLECTSRDEAFGRLGPFTENRYALLITENGGVVVPTPASRPEDNTFGGYTRVLLEPEGGGNAVTLLRHTGDFHDRYRSLLWEQPANHQREFLIGRRRFKDFDEHTLEKGEIPGGGWSKLNMYIEKLYEFKAGSKYFFDMHIYPVYSLTLAEEKKPRVNDYLTNFPYVENDTTVWVLPEGFAPESLPPAAKLDGEAASFSASYTYNETTRELTAITRIQVKRNRIPAAQYTAARLFFNKVNKELEQKIIIKKP